MRSMRIAMRFARPATPPLLEEFFRSSALHQEIILGGQTTDGTETITSYVSGTVEAYETLMDGRDDVLDLDITPAGDGFFTYLRRELGRDGLSLLNALSQRTVVVIPPIEIGPDRTIRMTLAGHPDDLRAILAQTPEGISIDVRSIRDGMSATPTRLSERQRESLRSAWKVGYYEIPRRNGIEAVAAELDCAVSTASELLRRAESRLVANVLDVDSR